jgi:hypothetical protein
MFAVEWLRQGATVERESLAMVDLAEAVDSARSGRLPPHRHVRCSSHNLQVPYQARVDFGFRRRLCHSGNQLRLLL